MQSDLFGDKYPDRPGYVRDSDTSKEAADSLTEAALSQLKARILGMIKTCGWHGATCDEVEVALGGRHQTTSARIRELFLADLIYFDAKTRRLTRYNRKARVYWARV